MKPVKAGGRKSLGSAKNNGQRPGSGDRSPRAGESGGRRSPRSGAGGSSKRLDGSGKKRSDSNTSVDAGSGIADGLLSSMDAQSSRMQGTSRDSGRVPVGHTHEDGSRMGAGGRYFGGKLGTDEHGNPLNEDGNPCDEVGQSLPSSSCYAALCPPPFLPRPPNTQTHTHTRAPAPRILLRHLQSA